MDSESDKNLSKNVLKMKFMHRVKEHEEKLQSERERHNRTSEDEWIVEDPILKQINAQITRDEVSLTSHLFGRKSFMSFNPTIQKIQEEKESKMKKAEQETTQPETKQKSGTIEVADMAHRYQTLVSGHNKYAPKRGLLGQSDAKNSTPKKTKN